MPLYLIRKYLANFSAFYRMNKRLAFQWKFSKAEYGLNRDRK